MDLLWLFGDFSKLNPHKLPICQYATIHYIEFTFCEEKGYSRAAFSLESLPCTAFASMLSAKSARIVPVLASLGFVAPISSLFLQPH